MTLADVNDRGSLSEIGICNRCSECAIIIAVVMEIIDVLDNTKISNL